MESGQGNDHTRAEEIIKAFDRERSEARDLERRHNEETKDSHSKDRQVLIERRRHPR
jgi:hypothetical protein